MPRGASRFGSGWAWVVKSGNSVEVMSTANQDSPVMEGKFPVLGVGRVGTRLLPEISESAAGLPRRMVECGELAGSQPAAERRQVDLTAAEHNVAAP